MAETVRLEMPPFGDVERAVQHVGAALEMMVELANDAMYAWTFRYTKRDPDTGQLVGQLTDIRCVMPPLTPEADTMRNAAARLPMMDEYGYSASLEAEQRRKEWAARGVNY